MYYNQQANMNNQMGGMGGMGQMGQMGQMGGMGGMNPQMQGMMGQQGMGGQMGMQNPNYGQAYRNLDYEYTLPTSGYKPDAGWTSWDLANAQYNGGRLERSFFDNIVRLCREHEALKRKHLHSQDHPHPPSPPHTPYPRFAPDSSPDPPAERNLIPSGTIQKISSLTNFFATRHLNEEAAKDAHRRVYYVGEGADSGNKTLGGAAAYQAYLLWDRDHYSAYHANPTQDNRERLVALAVAELFSLWDRVQPRGTRATIDESAQFAAATAKHLFDRHYDIQSHSNQYGRPRSHSHTRGGYNSGYGADNDSDSDDDRRRHHRSVYGQSAYGNNAMPSHMMGQQNPMMQNQMMQQPGGMMGNPMAGGAGGGFGMGMAQPGMGAMGMPGAMANGMGGMGGMGMNGMGMGGMGGMGMNGMGMNGMGMGGMGGMGGMNWMGMQGGYGGVGMQGMNPMHLQQGVPPHGSMGESQAAPGMHPYTYGAQSGVAYGNQPIDQMGNPTYPGGPGGRSWYGYGQPRYF
ncbi:hypothetical protein IAT38_006519 [Cryptococcus sp. DSM 104549]